MLAFILSLTKSNMLLYKLKTCGNIVCIPLPTTTATCLRLITPILTTELSLGDNIVITQ